ncbi:CoF synthetase [Schumannella soli]|uniref:CoF synthetase n=1 Tax=Schumannella soli TaxID=2590779 RepID=A0A506Y5K5_9MICO|nr:CoF synthetase [Schumannella soli]
MLLPHYVPGSTVALSDDERWPALPAAARAHLDSVLAHPAAPVWRHRVGHRLDPAAVERARTELPTDDWLPAHLDAVRELPAYRGLRGRLHALDDFPLVSRAELAADIGGFVPRDADLSRLVQGSSSGSTGAALRLPDDIEDVARTFWLVHRLLAGLGVDWRPDPRRLALALVVHQRQAFTYVSPVPGFIAEGGDGGAGATGRSADGQTLMARLNLDPRDWPTTDRIAFLRDQDPQLISGNPSSLATLLEPATAAVLNPLAIVSGALHLTPALRAALETRFGVPVLDLYGLHETRPIAWRADDGPFRVLDTRVLVETVDAAGRPAGAARGELVVTAGSNPLLPLARYRTGDHGRLVERDGRPAIADLEGREHVEFVTAGGRAINTVDLTQYLQDAGALAWSLVQRADGSVTARVAGGDPERAARSIRALLAQPVELDRVARPIDLGEGKPRRFLRES